jgi:hypothetical protein
LEGGRVRVNIMTVKELLGHKTLAMTLRYAHLAPAHKVKALEMLDLQLNDLKSTAQLLHNRGVNKQNKHLTITLSA